MTPLPWLVYPGFFAIAFVYGSIGLGGATGYLAVLSLAGVTAPIVAPVVLVLNIVVAGISFGHFYRAGFFRTRLLVPFVLTSVPASLAGGLIPLSRVVFVFVLGVTLLAAGLRLLFLPRVDRDEAPGISGSTYGFLSLALGVVLVLLVGGIKLVADFLTLMS